MTARPTFVHTRLNFDRRAEDCAPYLRAHTRLNFERDAIENHKMKTRCFDHIDLRVTNMEMAGKFYGEFLPQLGFVHESPGEDYLTFYAGGGERPLEFLLSPRTKTIVPTARESRFGRTRAKKWIRFRNSCATLAVKILRVPKFARTTVRVTTPSFSRTPMATNSKFAAARSRYLQINL